MLKPKEQSGTLNMSKESLETIKTIADFFYISKSEVVEWAILSAKYESKKSFLKATKRLKRRENECEKIPPKAKGIKYFKTQSQGAKENQKRLFD